jgi:hypothetical protein
MKITAAISEAINQSAISASVNRLRRAASCEYRAGQV